MADAIIRGAGLERYYQDREDFAPRPEPLAGGWDALPLEPDEDGFCEIRLSVDGLRCASCVWVTENVLQRTEGVEEATVSYATGRATLRWDPERIGVGELAGQIAAYAFYLWNYERKEDFPISEIESFFRTVHEEPPDDMDARARDLGRLESLLARKRVLVLGS